MNIGDRIFEVQELLGLTHENAQSQKDKELLLIAIDALWFIWVNGQAHEFDDYVDDIEAGAPKRVIATFNTRAEADTWLKNHPKPPHMAYVLIADEYHIVYFSREPDRRSLLLHPILAYHLQELTRDGLPPAVAQFATREEARAWFQSQPAPPVQIVIQIGGEHHLAVYYRNIDHRALFPFSIVKMLEKKGPPVP